LIQLGLAHLLTVSCEPAQVSFPFPFGSCLQDLLSLAGVLLFQRHVSYGAMVSLRVVERHEFSDKLPQLVKADVILEP